MDSYKFMARRLGACRAQTADHVENPTNGKKSARDYVQGVEGKDEDSIGPDRREVAFIVDRELHALAPAVKPDDVEQITKDLSTKLKVDECAEEDIMQGVEPGEDYNSKGRVDGKSNANDGEQSLHGHPDKASTSATVSAAIPADHAEGTNRSTEDVNMSVKVEASEHVNDASPEEGTSSTMVRGSDIDEPGGTAASWPEEREMFQGRIENLEIDICYWGEQFEKACYDRDWQRNDAAGKEMRFQEACQERQWHINEAAEKEKEIIRLQQAHSAEYLPRQRDLKQMLSNSRVSNPSRHRRSSAIYACDASVIQELDSLIDSNPRRHRRSSAIYACDASVIQELDSLIDSNPRRHRRSSAIYACDASVIQELDGLIDSNPPRHRRSSAIYAFDASAIQELDSLIDVITRRNVNAPKSSDPGQHWIVSQGNEELVVDMKASTSATVSAAIPADHAEGTNRSTEDVNMSVKVESSAHVNDTLPEVGTSSTMVRGSDIDEPGGTLASWPEEREMLRRHIKSLEIDICYWREQFQKACYDRDWHQNDAAGKEIKFQKACQERQWHINEAAEKEKEIIRLQEAHSAEYLPRLRYIKQMLSNSSVSNPGRFLDWSWINRIGNPEAKPCAADALQQLNSLIDVITRRNVSSPKSSDPGQHCIVSQGNEELVAEIKSLQHAVASLEPDNGKLRKNLSSMEIEHGKLSQGGSYRENSATPTHVFDGLTNLSFTVDSFKTRLVKYMLKLLG